MKKLSKLLSIILAAEMLIPSMPMSALADVTGPEDSEPVEVYDEDGEGEESSEESLLVSEDEIADESSEYSEPSADETSELPVEFNDESEPSEESAVPEESEEEPAVVPEPEITPVPSEESSIDIEEEPVEVEEETVSEGEKNSTTTINCSGTNWPESAHSYSNSMDTTWVYTDSSAVGFSITFSSSTKTESGWDYIYIYDVTGTQLGKYDGTTLAGQTINITGNTFKIRLTSDSSSVFYGFSLSQLITTTPQTDENGFKYTVNNSAVTIVGYTGDSQEISIPSMIDELPVTAVGSSAFSDCIGLTSLTIPDSVISIGSSAFYNCFKLTSLTIPDSVTSIGSDAFYNCSNLTSITVPNSVTTIGEGAFSGCSSLTEITLPFIGSSRAANGTYKAVFGYIFGVDEDWGTCQYYSAYSCKYYNIPSSLKKVTITDAAKIPYGAFYGCSNLTSIAISDGVTAIGTYAFYNCSSLTSITMPSSVTSIGKSAVYGSKTSLRVYYTGSEANWQEISGYANITRKVIYSIRTIGDANTVISGIKTMTYTGSQITQSSISIIYDGQKLIDDTDYTLSYKNNVNAGTATVTITGQGDYKGSKNLTFTISPKSISQFSMTLSKSSYVYSGAACKPTVTVKNGTTKFSSDFYTVQYKNNINAGTATVIVTGKGNYTGTLKKTFTINKKSISSLKASLSKTTYTYTGKAIKPQVTVKSGSKKISSKYYTVKYSKNINAGTAVVTITGKGNYQGKITKKFRINKAKPVIKIEATYADADVGGFNLRPGLKTKLFKVFVSSGSNYNGVKYNAEYSSSDTSVVKVNSKGYIEAVNFGTAYVTMTVKASKNLKSNSVKVKIVVTDWCRLTESSLSIYEGCSHKISLRYAESTVTWSSSNTSVATVTNGKIYGVNAGSCTIYAYHNGRTYSCYVTVKDNEWTNSNASTDVYSKVSYGNWTNYIRRIYWQNGDIYVTFRYYNRMSYTLLYIMGKHVIFRDEDGDAICTLSSGRIDIYCPSNSYRDITLKVTSISQKGFVWNSWGHGTWDDAGGYRYYYR